ncbi:MAG TPA: cell division protein FtsQ/DivIB [Candidatus Binataceae bacterium]|nr:cell division protein FtsQ/DivIB [Candidatus Binataceae bacterium]
MAKRAASKRSKGAAATAARNSWGWSSKALGLVLCAFFVLGMATGLSQAGRVLAARARVTLAGYWAAAAGTFAQWRDRSTESAMLAPLPRTAPGDAIALVERHDGFYALFAEGELRGPVQASRAGDLPILSGAAVQTAGAPDLVRYAATLVRSEVALSGLVSEMRVDGDDTVSLFFDRSQTELRVDLDGAPAQLKRAMEVLGQWRGHEQMVAMIDMTTPGQAVMRLRGMTPFAVARGVGAVRRVAERTRVGGGLRAGGGGWR